jgi:NADPH-ferrihemoprotein reductase
LSVPSWRTAGALHAAKETRNIAQKLTESDKQVVVWGSQSGTAEGFANRLARDIAWRDDLFAAFRRNLGITETDPQYIPTLTEDESLGPIDLHYGEPDPHLLPRAQCSAVRPLRVISTRELFSPSAGLHLDLDLAA